MASVNKAFIVGNLGKDPELRYMPNGDAVCNISVATTESWKDKDTGDKKEITEWHRIIFYRKLAEIAGQYLKTGSSVFIEGRIQTRKWTDKDGIERYTTEIIANEMKILVKRNEATEEQMQNRSNAKEMADRKHGSGSFQDFEDDIPF